MQMLKTSKQNCFGGYHHDSLQYHFFCGGMVGGCRLFHTSSLQHASLWIFDGEKYYEFINETRSFDMNSTEQLSVKIGKLMISQVDKKIFIHFDSDGSQKNCVVELEPLLETSWEDTISTVVHQPKMRVCLSLKGKNYEGVGYSKRYSWTPAPSYWGYRFIQGFVEEFQTCLWTAEATFGLNKYDYFKILTPENNLITTPTDVSCHRKNGAFAITSDGPLWVEIEPLSIWEVKLKSSKMNSFMQQRACRLVLKSEDWQRTGYAINETCYGSLG